jgi:Na+-translocating ferredoxin:NAD+ oxidoreductase RnfG subunit
MKALVYISVLFWLSAVNSIPKNYQKKIDKEIHAIFEIASYNKIPVELDQEILGKMTKSFNAEGFFKIIKEEVELGYFYFGHAPSKADEFDYVVIFDQNLIIKKIKILAYREDYGGEISSKRWLRQFDGIQTGTALQYGKDIKGISGATISARSMTAAVNELLSNIALIEYQ